MLRFMGLRSAKLKAVAESAYRSHNQRDGEQHSPDQHYVPDVGLSRVHPTPNERPYSTRHYPDDSVDSAADLKLFDEHDDEANERSQTNNHLQDLHT
jgi:hypothetical protein